jgi:hypothetical protein
MPLFPEPVPPVPALPQVVLTVTGPQQLQLQSNLATVPGVWRQVAKILLQGYELALTRAVQKDQAGGERLVVVPGLGLNGLGRG